MLKISGFAGNSPWGTKFSHPLVGHFPSICHYINTTINKFLIFLSKKTSYIRNETISAEWSSLNIPAMCCLSRHDLAQSWNVWDVCAVPHSADQTLAFANPLFSVLSHRNVGLAQNWADSLEREAVQRHWLCCTHCLWVVWFGSLASLAAVELFVLASPK